MIRNTILEIFRTQGKPLLLDQIAERLGISSGELSRKLLQEQRLANLGDLSLEEAKELISFYGRDVIFTEDLVNTIEQYLASRKKIEGYEKQARGAGLLPPEENK